MEKPSMQKPEQKIDANREIYAREARATFFSFLLYRSEKKLDPIDYAILSMIYSVGTGQLAFTAKQIAGALRLHKNTIREHCKKLAKERWLKGDKVGNVDVYTAGTSDEVVKILIESHFQKRDAEKEKMKNRPKPKFVMMEG